MKTNKEIIEACFEEVRKMKISLLDFSRNMQELKEEFEHKTGKTECDWCKENEPQKCPEHLAEALNI